MRCGSMPATDPILDLLRRQPGPLGSLAKAFPGRTESADNTHWIDGWFVAQATAFLGPTPPHADIRSSAATSDVLAPLRKPPATSKVRLNTIQPNYFRGFRGQASPIALDADLVVVEGRNSSGKTSLAEAFEWLFTGQLSRRSAGHARELAKCIGNEFRPADEQTWVEGVVTVDGDTIRIRRALTEDYSDRQNASTTSDLLVDGQRVKQTAAEKLLGRLFAGVAPILMQHTLSQFIHDSPDNRRRYFERLLQLDELTTLIEKAVVGDAKACDFAPSVGAVSHTRWRLLRDALKSGSKGVVDRFEKKAESVSRMALEQVLVAVAIAEFRRGNAGGAAFEALTVELRAEHARDRERRFPFLNELRPRPGTAKFVAGSDGLTALADGIDAAFRDLLRAKEAVRDVSVADLAIARAIDSLIAGGLIDATRVDHATCPVCEYQPVPTLAPSRVAALQARLPLAAAVDLAGEGYRRSIATVADQTRAVHGLIQGILIGAGEDAHLKSQIAGLDPGTVIGVVALNASAKEMAVRAEVVMSELGKADQLLADGVRGGDLAIAVRAAGTGLSEIRRLLGLYAEHFSEVERTLGVVALDDPRYALRDKWLDVADDCDGVVQAISWERAKVKAQQLLKGIREGLIALRTAVIEAARRDFSERMTEVWRMLRDDTASAFSQLYIPEVKGKGYKLEMEVKARISDGTRDVEVDALKVFSESQVNVVGLAACITRAQLLGHTVLIFDDPVQSMDEEHYLSFAGALVDTLIGQGFQVIILTHSDQFGRDVADAHYKRDSFLTLRSRASKRHGAVIEEGNRRVAERLKNADDLADNGKLDVGWNRVRLALERMFLLAHARVTKGFDTRTWRSQTGEAMWNAGAGTAIEAAAPGSGERLKAILKLTAAGAHDGSPRGVKDLKEATKYIRSLLAPLQIGDG